MGSIKAKAHENLSEENVSSVIELLEGDDPPTKKAMCEKLNISYNTTRLTTIIKEYKDKKAFAVKMRAKMRSKPIDDSEAYSIIKDYLYGSPLADISKEYFRSSVKIKGVLAKFNIPLRQVGNDYFKPELLPEGSVVKEYKSGDLVYSARYNTMAIVRALFSKTKEHGNVYSISLLGKDRKNAYQPYYELGTLTHIQNKIGLT